MLTLSRPSWLGARKAAREGLYTYMPISARTSALGRSITSYSLGIAPKFVWTSPPYTSYQLWRAGGGESGCIWAAGRCLGCSRPRQPAPGPWQGAGGLGDGLPWLGWAAGTLRARYDCFLPKYLKVTGLRTAAVLRGLSRQIGRTNNILHRAETYSRMA